MSKIIATIIGFSKEGEPTECIALWDGFKIKVDPFVSSIWEWEHKENLLGTWYMEGQWTEGKTCFLPDKIIKP